MVAFGFEPADDQRITLMSWLRKALALPFTLGIRPGAVPEKNDWRKTARLLLT